jgi:hypothetical protein
VERVLAYIVADTLALANAVSDCWFVVQHYDASDFCNMLEMGSIPQNITTTVCGEELLSNLVFISKYVISWTTLLISEALKGTQAFLG